MPRRWLLLATLVVVAACSRGGQLRAATTTAPTPASPTTPTTTPTTTGTTTAPASTTTTVPGPPYTIAELTFPLVDPSRPTVSHGRTISSTRTLTTLVWTPERAGRRPLIVFAHGFQVGPGPYTSLLEAWAEQGYVVAAPEFPLTDQAIAGANLDEDDIDNQPADVRFVTDWLVSARSPVSGRIDSSRVAVAGHSDGAETVLAAATAPVPAGEPRYRAVIVMGAQPVPGAAGRNPPILVCQGDADTINPPAYGQATFQEAAPPKYFLDIHGGGHLPPLEGGSPWLPGIEAVTVAFLDAYVAGDGPKSGVVSVAARYPDLSLATD